MTIKRYLSGLTNLAFALTVAGSDAWAHTEAKISSMDEGTSADNALAIGHGCETANGDRSVIAQSVVFPQGDLSGIIQQGTLASLVDTIQGGGIFALQAEKTDSLGNVIGFSGRNGSLATFSQGRVPFSFTAPNFEPGSCVQTLHIEMAVADICQTSNPKIRPGKVNIWMPALTGGPSTGIVAQAASQGIDGYGHPAEITIHRDMVNNAPAPDCTGPTEMTISPTTDEVNSKLPIPGYW